jgi:ACR3 family arsenite transporter
VDIEALEVVKSVLIYLGIPFAAGYLSRIVLIARRGAAWYESVFVPRVSPLTLIGLLFTIVIMFGMQGELLSHVPDVLLIAVPLTLYFLISLIHAAFWLRDGWFSRSSAEVA